jgi:hypothetical protein
MRFVTKAHRLADHLFAQEQFAAQYKEIESIILGISDEDIKDKHLSEFAKQKSLSMAINSLLHERFVASGWLPEAPIFRGGDFATDKTWRLDFAKGYVSVEVGFNHGEAIAWNLIKPVLASEVNNVEKAISTKIGVMICGYLTPLNSMLTVPVLIIGLRAPEAFKISHSKNEKGKKFGEIVSS